MFIFIFILILIPFLLILVAALLYYKMNNNKLGFIIASFFILIIMVSGVYFVFENRSCDYFDTEFNKYNEVISLIKESKLKPVDTKSEGSITKRLYLPKGYKKLSKDGVVFYGTQNGVLSVLFVKSWPIMGETPDGYLYKADNFPATGDDFKEARGFVVKIKDKWFINRDYTTKR